MKTLCSEVIAPNFLSPFMAIFLFRLEFMKRKFIKKFKKNITIKELTFFQVCRLHLLAQLCHQPMLDRLHLPCLKMQKLKQHQSFHSSTQNHNLQLLEWSSRHIVVQDLN